MQENYAADPHNLSSWRRAAVSGDTPQKMFILARPAAIEIGFAVNVWCRIPRRLSMPTRRNTRCPDGRTPRAPRIYRRASSRSIPRESFSGTSTRFRAEGGPAEILRHTKNTHGSFFMLYSDAQRRIDAIWRMPKGGARPREIADEYGVCTGCG